MLNIVKSAEATIPESPQQWLQQLKRPTAFEIAGRDSTQWRAVSVLVHGNEPSGFFAAHRYLRQQVAPLTNLSIIVSSVRAARHPPEFTHRHMPGEYDLNRRFGVFERHDRVSELARDITDYLRALRPSVVVDLHNTSGRSPAFAVSVSDHPAVKSIASLFTDSMVVTQLIVGSLMEQNFNCPVVTIECGGAQQKRSHQLAFAGLQKFAAFEELAALHAGAMSIHYHPTRVRLQPGISLEYGAQSDHEVDITLIDGIEQLNQGLTAKGTLFGWVDRSLGDCLSAIDDHGRDIIHEIFEIDQGRLLAKQELKIFMATRRTDIAMSDCVFYAVGT